MPALTVWQPWATLIAIGAKPYEFRGWEAPRRYRGKRIAIHAGARPVKKEELDDLLLRLQGAKPWTTALKPELAIPLLERAHMTPQILPRSAVLCTAVLGEPRLGYEVAPEFGGVINDSDRDEHANWAWPVGAIEQLQPPVEARGAQGFWMWGGA